MDCIQRRTEMPLDRGTRGGNLSGDLGRDEFSHDAWASRCALVGCNVRNVRNVRNGRNGRSGSDERDGRRRNNGPRE